MVIATPVFMLAGCEIVISTETSHLHTFINLLKVIYMAGEEEIRHFAAIEQGHGPKSFERLDFSGD
jgi:hypothetical protein